MRPTKWTETAIRQAFDDFVKQHDRLPTKQEMYEKHKGKFPRPLSVKITTGITLWEYLKENYTTYIERKQARIYGVEPNEYWIEDFKKQYIEYNHPIEDEYNNLRKSKTPCTQTLRKMAGVKTWGEFLEYCGLQREDKVELVGNIEFEETLENYEKLNNILQNFLQTLR